MLNNQKVDVLYEVRCVSFRGVRDWKVTGLMNRAIGFISRGRRISSAAKNLLYVHAKTETFVVFN